MKVSIQLSGPRSKYMKLRMWPWPERGTSKSFVVLDAASAAAAIAQQRKISERRPFNESAAICNPPACRLAERVADQACSSMAPQHEGALADCDGMPRQRILGRKTLCGDRHLQRRFCSPGG